MFFLTKKNLKNGKRKSMLNREDIRKVIEAYERVKLNIVKGDKDLDDASMRQIQEAVLKEIQYEEDK